MKSEMENLFLNHLITEREERIKNLIFFLMLWFVKIIKIYAIKSIE